MRMIANPTHTTLTLHRTTASPTEHSPYCMYYNFPSPTPLVQLQMSSKTLYFFINVHSKHIWNNVFTLCSTPSLSLVSLKECNAIWTWVAPINCTERPEIAGHSPTYKRTLARKSNPRQLQKITPHLRLYGDLRTMLTSNSCACYEILA